MNKFSTLSDVSREQYQAFLEDINAQLEPLKQTYADPLDGILKYNASGVCTTFFGKVQWPVSLEDIEAKETELGDDLQKIASLKTSLTSHQDIPQSIQKAYLKSLDSLQEKLSMFQNALRIEAEKSGYVLSEEQRSLYSSKVMQLQKHIYGECVSDTPTEVEGVLLKLHQLYEKHKEHLTAEDLSIFSTFLEKSDQKFWYTFSVQETAPTSSLKETNNINAPKSIDRTTLKKLSQYILNFYKDMYPQNEELQHREVLQDAGIKSINISGMNEQLNIPEDDTKLDATSVTKTITWHEIEQHLLQRTNNNTFLGKGFTTGSYDFIAEGLAMINEDISTGKINSLEDLKNDKGGPTRGIISVFIAENTTYQESLPLFEVYKKFEDLEDQKESTSKEIKDFAITRATRAKRFVPYDRPGASVKDTLYQRGKNRVIDYLTEDNSLQSAIEKYKELNTFKFGPQELALIKEIKAELHITDDQLVFPLFIGRVLADKLAHKKGSLTHYLDEMNLDNKDITLSAKRDLISILQHLRENTA